MRLRHLELRQRAGRDDECAAATGQQLTLQAIVEGLRKALQGSVSRGKQTQLIVRAREIATADKG